MKFGVIIPTTIAEAQELDRIDGNTLWMDAVCKEIKDSREAFRVLDEDGHPPGVHKKIGCHIIFEVKADL